MAKPQREFTRFIWWIQTKRRGGRQPSDQANRLGLRVRQKDIAPTVHIHHRHFIITQPESWYSFHRPTEGGRLSRPRHCSKGVQPVPKAVYHSGCRDKHNCRRWNSNMGPLTPQSGMLPLDHWDTARSVVCVSVCVLFTRVSYAKRLNRLRCSLGADSCRSNEPFVRWGTDLRREGALSRGYVPTIVTYLRISALYTVRLLPHMETNAFAAARDDKTRCGLLPNYFWHLLF